MGWKRRRRQPNSIILITQHGPEFELTPSIVRENQAYIFIGLLQLYRDSQGGWNSIWTVALANEPSPERKLTLGNTESPMVGAWGKITTITGVENDKSSFINLDGVFSVHIARVQVSGRQISSKIMRPQVYNLQVWFQIYFSHKTEEMLPM